jgi:hypothetical protein
MNKFQIPFTPIEALLPDPGDTGNIDIGVYQSISCALTTGASGETRTLIAPSKVNQRVTLWLDTDGGGDAVVTINNGVSGLTSITLDDAADTEMLIAISVGGAVKWKKLAV